MGIKMDNYSLFTNMPMAIGFLNTLDGKDFVANLDDYSRNEVINHSGDFQSKEEVERFLYHLDHPDSTK